LHAARHPSRACRGRARGQLLAALEALAGNHQLPPDRAAGRGDLLVLRGNRGRPRRPHPALPVAMRSRLQPILERIPPDSPVSPVLWFAVLGAPGAYATQLGLGYWLTEAQCSPTGDE